MLELIENNGMLDQTSNVSFFLLLLLWLQDFFYYPITKTFWFTTSGAKEKASFESFKFLFNIWKIILSRSKPSFKMFPSGLGNPHNVIGNA